MITLRAPAKVNLYLHVLGVRRDGYHELLSRMQKIDLCDIITLDPTREPGIVFACDDKALAGDDNLVLRAARLFYSAAKLSCRQGLAIRLEKKIPVAAGLGGGSSDAATVLLGLNRLHNYPLSVPALGELAAQIGSDVPFFAVAGSAALATGRGERLVEVENLDAYWYLLVNPGVAVSTKWVFDNYALTSGKKKSKLLGSQRKRLSTFSPKDMHNDLEPITMKRYPAVAEIKDALLRAGADAALMSGSGPTVYGLFLKNKTDSAVLDKLAERLSAVYDGRVWLTRAYTGV